ncbi:mRNA capping enzyme, alpha subunit [Lojkania enalia]|uniref:mRNA-capping enzyme subunit alpha n=1 Tax=Lojkania enalia TaxID=147567 RepID=A0A9P4NBT5_9PLEO|nr:mRNA capping enzyme, alpha subunit [Didymosphaeria enalia]
MHSSAPPQIPGYLIDDKDADGLQADVASLLGRKNKRFPGAQPVSFSRQHIAELERSEYFMCEKTDGVRCLLFLYFRASEQNPDNFEPVTLLIDRKNNYYDVTPPLRFPYYRFPRDADKFLFNTILDGELVHDRVPGQPNPRLIYYAFDCLVSDGTNLTGKPYDKRIGYMKQVVFEPYNAMLSRNPGAAAHEPFRVKEKQVYVPYHIKHMFHEVLPNLPHGNDGLVFTCKNTPYEFGTDNHILKWKPPHENTIDFKLKLGEYPMYDPEDGLPPYRDYNAKPDKFQLQIHVEKNHYKTFDKELTVTNEEWEKLKSLGQRLDGRIIECYRDTDGTWRYKREDDGTPRWRDDKRHANHYTTVNSVLQSIEDPVTEADLIAAEGKVKQAVYKMRDEERQKQKHEQWQRDQMEREAKKRKYSEVNGGH